MHDYQLKWIGIWANCAMIIYRFNNNCQCCSFVAVRVLSDLLNQAFSVHLCELSHSNSPQTTLVERSGSVGRELDWGSNGC